MIEHYKNDLLTLTKQADISFNGTGVTVRIECQSTKKYKYSTGKFLYYTDIGSIHKEVEVRQCLCILLYITSIREGTWMITQMYLLEKCY